MDLCCLVKTIGRESLLLPFPLPCRPKRQEVTRRTVSSPRKRDLGPLRTVLLFLLLLAGFLAFAATVRAETIPLEISGVEDPLREVLQQGLAPPQVLSAEGQLNRRWLRHYQKQLPEEVRTLLEPYGYFYSHTESHLVEVPGGGYQLQLDVTPGEPLHITGLDLQLTGPGADLPVLKKKRADFPLQVGDILRQDIYEEAKADLQQTAFSLGYLDARFSEHEIRVHLADRRAEIRLTLTTGIRYRFGDTRFHGAEDYPDRYLRRFLAYRPEGFFSYEKIGQTQLQLYNADQFRKVEVRALTEETEAGQVPVDIELQPAPKHQLRPGIGYGTDTGARLTFKYRTLNLWHRAQELSGDLLLAERRQSLLTTYLIPDLRRADSQTRLRLGYDREDNDTYLSRKLFSEAEYERIFSKTLTGSVFVRLNQEYSRIGDQDNNSQLLLPGIRINWRKLDNPVTPRQGLQARLKIQGAQEGLLSDTSLLQAAGDVTGLLPLPQRLSLLVRLRAGTTWQKDEIEELPASLRFFAGGDQSVRGYKYQSLGPKNDDGDVIGGRHVLVANLELEKSLTEKWGVAAFYDIGNAFDNFGDYELEQGAGLGIRRYTQIGALRLDLARQVGGDQRFRLHLSVGFGW